MLQLVERHPFLIHYAVTVFANSQWLGETLIKNPDLFQDFVRERGLDRLRTREDSVRVCARPFTLVETDIACSSHASDAANMSALCCATC